MLQFYNALTHGVETFEPITPGYVGMYCCGPTVYNPATIGNLRAYVFEDVLKRTLVSLGYEVKHVMNITDVGHLVGDGDVGEDKMEREAVRLSRTAWDIARENEARFFQDMERLNVLRPDVTPRATEHIKEQVALVVELEKKGFIYRTSDGIYFDTAKFPEYGKLSGQKLSDKEAGARVELNDEKRNVTDFALWKFSPTDKKRQMEWESPWGIGFPGWHIECSAMSAKYLGQPFDIHCGGIDHIAVHHENEIAQSEAAYDKPLANYWLHNEFLTVDGRRMGKSEGNAYTLDDVVAKGFDPSALRYYYLGAHYRTKLNFTWEALDGAKVAFEKIKALFHKLPTIGRTDSCQQINALVSALEDDLNTPRAIAILWETIKSSATEDEKAALLACADKMLGLGLAHVSNNQSVKKIPDSVRILASERQSARLSKNWAKADELRQKIEEVGWHVDDRANDYSLTPRHE